MADKSASRRLQNSIIVYSALGFFVTGVIVAFVSVTYLFTHLKKNHDETLLFGVKTRSMAVEEYLSRARDVTLQVTSRTRIRDYLDTYNSGEISLDELVNFSEPILIDAKNLSKEMAGISRLDHKNNLVVQVGLPIPEELRQVPDEDCRGAIIHGPAVLGSESYLVVSAPILDRQSKRIGTDIVLFDLTRLQRIVKDYTGLGETGETILGVARSGRVRLFFPLRGIKDGAPESIPKESPLGSAFVKAFNEEVGILPRDKSSDNTEAFAYGPVRGSKWGIVVKMNRDELYASAYHQIVIISGIIVVLILFGTFGMGLLIRPFTGRMVLLEQEIRAKTAALENELGERRRAEERTEHLYRVLLAIRNVNQLIVREKDTSRLIEHACEILIETRGYYNAWIALMDESGAFVAATEAGLGECFSPIMERLKRGAPPDCARKALKQSGVVVTADPSSECTDCPISAKCDGGSCMGVPFEHDGKVYGLLSVCIPSDLATDAEEQELLEEVAGDIAFALKAIETEEEIKRTKELLQSIIDNTSDLVCTIDLEGNFLSINKAVTELLGYEEKDLIGRPKIEIATDPEQFKSVFREVLEKGSLSNLEVPFKRKDGTIADILYSVTLLKDKEGNPVAVAGLGKDITKRNRAREELRRANRALKVISDCNHVLVRAVEEIDLLRDACRIIVETGGYRLAWICFAEEDEEKTVRPVAQAGYEQGYLETVNITWADTWRGSGPTGTAIRTGRPSICKNIMSEPEYVPWRAEATKRGFQSSIALPMIVEGRVVGALNIYAAEPDAFDEEEIGLLSTLVEDLAYGIAVLHTRTERRRAERERKQFLSALEEKSRELERRERFLSDVLNDMLTFVGVLEPDGNLIFVNNTPLEISGLKEEDVVGKMFYDAYWWGYSEEAMQTIKGDIKRCASGETLVREIELQVAGGGVIWVEFSMHPVYGENGKIKFLVPEGRDITDRKRIEEKLRVLTQKMISLSDAERARLSHELHDEMGQQLTAMLLEVESLKGQDKSDPKRIDLIMDMLTNLVEELKRICKGLRPAAIDKLGLVRALKTTAREFESRGAFEVEISISEIEENEIDSEIARCIYRVFQETFTNVARHSKAERVSLCFQRKNSDFILEVNDDGTGFSEEVVIKGRGLGIIGMRERVAYCGGTLEIKSEPGHGTRVIARLPTQKRPGGD